MGEQELIITSTDKHILRELAKHIAEIASQKIQEEKKNLWVKHNSLQETRPLIFCDPENAWYEVIPANQLECEGSLARVWEFSLRKEIYWAEKIKDDRVTEGLFSVYHIFDEGSRGFDAKVTGGDNGGAYRWDSPLTDYNFMDKIHFKQIRVNREKTDQLVQFAQEVFQDTLKIKLEGSWWWSLGMTSDLVFLRGFEQMLLDMYDEPANLHRIMAFLRDENLEKIDYLEEQKLLTLNNGGNYIGTGGYGWCNELPSESFDGKKVRTMDMWGFCESQETVNVSPEMFEEFVFPYQLEILERFGLNIYGCCEPLDKRWNIIRRIPRLRKVTVSPWSDVNVMAEYIGKNYIFCRKVNPAFVSTGIMDESAVRAQLRDTFKAVYRYGCPTEVLLRDILTLSGKGENAIRWTQIAREEAERGIMHNEKF